MSAAQRQSAGPNARIRRSARVDVERAVTVTARCSRTSLASKTLIDCEVRRFGPGRTILLPCAGRMSYVGRVANVSAPMTRTARARRFYGWRVVGAAFMLAVFGWGTGFYGPPVYLHAVRETRGWPLALVSAAVTVHFLIGAVAVANLPALYRRFGLAAITSAAAFSMAVGVLGWAIAATPWQLLLATLLSGVGWAGMSGAAVNAIVSPWFVRARPAALAMAYNGASIGGVVFSPLWVAAIGVLGFP